MEDKFRLKIVSSWISTSKDYLEIIELKKEIVETIKEYVENLLGKETLKLIEEARSINSDCILEQGDIGLGFLGDFKEEYCPKIKGSIYNILPRYNSYNGRYVKVFDTNTLTGIRDLRIDFKYQCPRLFDYSLESFDNLEVTGKEVYDRLKDMLIRYLIVCDRLGRNVDIISRVLSHKDMTKTRLKKELPKLYELC